MAQAGVRTGALLGFFCGLWPGAALAAGPASAPPLSPASDRSLPVSDSMDERVLACTHCHGAQGRAAADGYYPRIAGKPADYLFGQLQAFRDGRRGYAPMQALLSNLDDDYLAELARHFAQQQLPHPPPPPSRAAAAQREAGRRLVEQGDAARSIPACANCHGAALTGRLPAIPGLAGLPADYLAAQIGAWQTGQRRSLQPDCMAQIARRLRPDDVAALLAWVGSSRVPANGAALAASEPAAADGGRPHTGVRPAGADAGPADCGVPPPADAGGRPAPTPDWAAPTSRGALLVTQANCTGCHTRRGGPHMAGGVPVLTPFGTVYGSNLTPDADTGLGRWSAAQFRRALHEGVRPDGRRLLPAFPFTSYHRIPADDAEAMFEHLRSLPAVHEPSRPAELDFGLGSEAAQWFWRRLAFSPMDPAQARNHEGAAPDSAGELERGRYLVEGPGHCTQCHSERNALGIWRNEGALRGADMPVARWHAPSLRDPALTGSRSARLQPAPRSTPQGQPPQPAQPELQALMDLLQTGTSGHAVAMGPMADIVRSSLQHWPDADLRATARYLLSIREPWPAARDGRARRDGALAADDSAGGQMYRQHCARCHGDDGEGRAGMYPALNGNPVASQPEPDNLIHAILEGGYAPTTARQRRPFGMPPFGASLQDAQIATLVNHLRARWGTPPDGRDAFPPVKAASVRALRSPWRD